MKTALVIAFVACIAISGCRTLQPEYSLFKSEHEEQTDALWRQGFGYNNPNAERIRDGRDSVNFDGSSNTFESAAENVGAKAIGNVIGFAIFEGIPAWFRGISQKLQR